MPFKRFRDYVGREGRSGGGERAILSREIPMGM